MGGAQKSLKTAVTSCGCSDRDAGHCINLALCAAMPFMPILWRRQMRSMFGIDGGTTGDIVVCACCFPCMVMQESRELKSRNITIMSLPVAVSMK